MSDTPRYGTVKMSDVVAHPTHRMDAEYWLDRAEGEHRCTICHEPIVKIDGRWTHRHGDQYCGCGDGSVAYPPEELITETDVLDEEIEQLHAWVRCENCDYGDVAERMTRDYYGAWLCWPCARAEGIKE